jgi:hypothetical protein
MKSRARPRLRSAVILAVALAAVLSASVAASASAEVTHNPKGHFLGIMPSSLHRTVLTAGTAQGTPPLTYHGGPVVHSSRVYAIYWRPPGTYIPAGYQAQIAQYFTDVAASSWKTTNVYAALTQYCSGVANGASSCPSASDNFSSYSVAYGGAFIDTASKFPTTGNCPNYTLGDGTTSTNCLTDAQIQAEVNKVVTAEKWATGLGTEFFVFTPAHVGECFTIGGTSDPNGGCYDPEFSPGFCAYHSNVGGTKLYAFQPWADLPGCQYSTPNNPYPNDNGADITLNVVSHEHNETMSDPLGTSWYDSQGYENGDECAWLALTTHYNNIGDYSQVINGDDYLLQSEWSNRAKNCVLSNTYPQPTASFTTAAGSAAHSVNFTLTRSDSDDTSFRYAWTFGDGTTSTLQSPTHTYAAAGAKTVTVVVFDAHGDQIRVAKAVTVS